MTNVEEFFEFVKQYFPYDNIRFERYTVPSDFMPRYKIFFNETEVKDWRLTGEDWELIDIHLHLGQSKKSMFNTLTEEVELAIIKSL